MKTIKLSFAFACLLGLGIPSLARAQDNTAQSATAPEGNVSLSVQTAMLPGRAGSRQTLNINLKTGAYTVENAGIMDHMIELQSQGTLTAAQLKSVTKALDTAKDANPPAQMPGAPVDGASSFTLSWGQGSSSHSVSGPDNEKGATYDQPASVKAVWNAVNPLLKSMSTMTADLVKDHPYVPNVKTVEGADGAKPASKTVDLGHLDSPGTELMKAAAAKGVGADGGLVLKPGEKITFTTDRNQINGIASMESSNPDITVTSKIVKNMNPGQLGDELTVEWTIAAKPGAGNAVTAEITANGDYQSRNDPVYNFKIGASVQPAVAENTAAQLIGDAAKAAAKAGTTVEGGIDPRIVNRGGAEGLGPRTGMGQLIDERLSDAKAGDAKGDGK